MAGDMDGWPASFRVQLRRVVGADGVVGVSGRGRGTDCGPGQAGELWGGWLLWWLLFGCLFVGGLAVAVILVVVVVVVVTMLFDVNHGGRALDIHLASGPL